MKKILLLSLSLCCIVISVRSQDVKTQQVNIETKFVEVNRLFFRANLGIAFGTDPEMVTQTTTIIENETSSTTAEALKARLGTGLPVGVAAGYMFTENFGAELGIDYLQGFTTNIVNSYNGDEEKRYISAVHLSIVPMVRAQFQAGKVIPYVTLGLDIGVVNDFKVREEDDTHTLKIRDYGGISVGTRAAGGVEYPLNKTFSAFAEIVATQFSFSPKHGKVTKYEVNGQDELGNLSKKEALWDYVKSLNSSEPRPDDMPNKLLRETHSVDNVALEVGIIIRPTLVKSGGHE